jgi:hypothetical protein
MAAAEEPLGKAAFLEKDAADERRRSQMDTSRPATT